MLSLPSDVFSEDHGSVYDNAEDGHNYGPADIGESEVVYASKR